VHAGHGLAFRRRPARVGERRQARPKAAMNSAPAAGKSPREFQETLLTGAEESHRAALATSAQGGSRPISEQP